MSENNSTGKFSIPSDRQVLWDYMDFMKLLFILTKRSIFFARSDMFEDPNEGLYTKKNIERIEQKKMDDPNYDDNWIRNIEHFRENIFINCWHMSSKESAAFWKIYSGDNKGIAIRTTFKRIKQSIDSQYVKDTWLIDPIYAKINYIDRNREDIGESNLLYPYINKDKCFRYENEFRIIIWATMKERTASTKFRKELFKIISDIDNLCKPNLSKENYQEFVKSMNSIISLYRIPDKQGIEIPFDVDRLIQKIYISPKAEKWHVDFIRFILRYLKYTHLANKIEKSTMYDATY